MDRQLDTASVSAYCDALSNLLISNFYEDHEVITGPELLKLTNVEQLNLLLAKQLFNNWKKEVGKLESPYFNYNNPEVEQAYKHFVNTLSQNISIKERDFAPLLRQSIEDVIVLSLCPYKYFKEKLLVGLQGKVSLEELKESKKYIKLNTFLIDELIKKYEGFNLKELSVEDVIDHFNDIYQANLSHVEEGTYIIEKLAKIYPTKIEELTIQTGITGSGETKEKPVEPQQSIVEEDTTTSEEELEPGVDSSVVVDSQEVEENDVQNEQIDVAEEIEEEQSTINTQYNENGKDEAQLSLNDQLKKNEDVETVASQYGKQSIQDIKSSMGINQKFMFINLLFDGQENEFEQAIHEVESSDNLKEATSKLFDNYGNRYSWDSERPEVKELFELVERRFN